jgi:hypothetical protein
MAKSHEAIVTQKQLVDSVRMIGALPFEFVTMLKYIKMLGTDEEVDYKYLKSLVKKATP